MSRIEELSTLVKNQTTLVDNLESLIEKERLLKTRYANELFEATKALEAQERKPRVFCIQLFEGGAITENTFRGTRPPLETITVREVKPIVVTKQMASIFLDCLTSGNVNPTTVSNGLKAAFNIDAEPSND